MADTEHPPAPPQYKRKTGATTPQPASRLKHSSIRSRPNTAEPQDHGRTSPSSTTTTMTTTIQGVRKFSKTLGKGHENSGQQKQQAQAGVPGQKNGGVGQGHLWQNSTVGNGAGTEEASNQVAFRIRGFSKKVEESTVVRYLQSLHP
ncbi:hypothetical protein EX30DRAFT_2790 [Ascodesmis nigricans]|uniref:Uncharacterized protein n=1 Tax=Ascodesmis nigricans TaxID=341454 RepID=A0A4S2N5J9_9PEZI|nr:hypothetical protein EX30DRAFT_2790 [Ascodesmis nigricans]